jgi:hypothetical protein
MDFSIAFLFPLDYLLCPSELCNERHLLGTAMMFLETFPSFMITCP